MSKPLGYYDPTMAEGSTPASLIASVKANILACGWQIVREDTSASPFIDLIPPPAQTIGNSLGREVVRLRAPAASNSLDVHTFLESPIGTPLLRTIQKAGSLSVDYTYGFIYFLAVLERTLLLGTKTNTAVYGGLYASYAENDLAVYSTPAGLIPIELMCGDLFSPVASFGGTGAVTHNFGYAVCPGHPGAAADVGDIYSAASWSHDVCEVTAGFTTGTKGVLQNIVSAGSDGWTLTPTPLATVEAACAGWAGAEAINSVGEAIVMASCGCLYAQGTGARQGTTRYVNYAAWVPSLPYPDVTAYLATAVNEGLHLVRSLVQTTLQTEMDATSDYAALTLGSTADLPASGTLVIGDECIPYTGKSGATVTGCTRSAYATAKAAHAVGTTVYLASWVVKINGCAMHAGYTKPGN